MATKAELQQIIDIIESDEYDSAEQMARAIFKQMPLILNQGNSWVGITRIPSPTAFPFELWGIFDNKTTAKSLMKLFDGNVAILPINGIAALTDREAVAEPPVAKKTDCSTCSHPLYAHWPGSKQKKQGCLTAGCKCTDGPGSVYSK